MANIEDYLLWRGDLTFEQDEFNLVDNLILAELAYVDFKDIIPAAGSGEKITLKQACDDFFELHDEEELKLVKSFIWYAPFFMKKMAQGIESEVKDRNRYAAKSIRRIRLC